MIERKSWDEFRNTGLLWWVNRSLHLLGWSIVVEAEDGHITEVYPARVKFRGFPRQVEEKGFVDLSNYLRDNISVIAEEIKE